MARHARAVDERPVRTRALLVAVVWLAGLVAGFFALLAAAADRTSCSASSTGLACRGSGTALGVLLVLGVIGTVTTVTVTTHGRSAGRIAAIAGLGLAALALWFALARALLATA